MRQQIDVEALEQGLAQFFGTEGYYRLSAIDRRVLATDGVQYLAEQAAAYWLVDAVASHLPSVPADEHFIVIQLKVAEDHKAELTLANDDPASRTYARQKIPFTDFPLASIKLYAARSDGRWVLMLPSEY